MVLEYQCVTIRTIFVMCHVTHDITENVPFGSFKQVHYKQYDYMILQHGGDVMMNQKIWILLCLTYTLQC